MILDSIHAGGRHYRDMVGRIEVDLVEESDGRLRVESAPAGWYSVSPPGTAPRDARDEVVEVLKEAGVPVAH